MESGGVGQSHEGRIGRQEREAGDGGRRWEAGDGRQEMRSGDGRGRRELIPHAWTMARQLPREEERRVGTGLESSSDSYLEKRT